MIAQRFKETGADLSDQRRERFPVGKDQNQQTPTADVRSIVERQFMQMTEAHDRIRSECLAISRRVKNKFHGRKLRKSKVRLVWDYGIEKLKKGRSAI
jgi:hypothetical protein